MQFPIYFKEVTNPDRYAVARIDEAGVGTMGVCRWIVKDLMFAFAGNVRYEVKCAYPAEPRHPDFAAFLWKDGREPATEAEYMALAKELTEYLTSSGSEAMATARLEIKNPEMLKKFGGK